MGNRMVIGCPCCGDAESPILKTCWDEDGGHIEVYRCVCGCRFAVTVEVLDRPSADGQV